MLNSTIVSLGKHDASVENEVRFAKKIFEENLKIDDQINDRIGAENFQKLAFKIDEKDDIWLGYELGGKSLSQQLCLINNIS